MIKTFTLIWFNDYFRFFVVLCGAHLLITAPIFYFVFGVEHIKYFCAISYLSIFLTAMIDNDYSRLRKFGYDEYGKKIDANPN